MAEQPLVSAERAQAQEGLGGTDPPTVQAIERGAEKMRCHRMKGGFRQARQDGQEVGPGTDGRVPHVLSPIRSRRPPRPACRHVPGPALRLRRAAASLASRSAFSATAL